MLQRQVILKVKNKSYIVKILDFKLNLLFYFFFLSNIKEN